MLNNILELKNLYEQLLIILKQTDDSDSSYIINQVEHALYLINECLDQKQDNEQMQHLFIRLKEIYKTMNQPRIGLSDYFIWKDDYEERVKANESLDIIKDRLFQLFS
ncbi:hypothetical protein ACPVTF_03075 [Geobacillus icigianus]|uniref:Uncharacterized protein n=1 Tax=Geobacillus subterraneus TaxID=129338 RepID=A0A679FUQ5_9BACL|nr:hypothetical protein [Geobacillus subterraneus]BBW97446.1 hypothetical protein GsuE55_22790 [Geobacillus subterraneus]